MNIPEGYALVPVDPIKAIDMGWAYLYAAREAEPSKSHSFSHAGYRAMIAAAPTVDIPAYDEAKERELFEVSHPVPEFVKWDDEFNHYLVNLYPDECDSEYGSLWDGWKACAKSRARSAE